MLTFEISLDNVSKLLRYLVPENAVYIFRYQGFDGKTTMEEKWYGTNYNENQLSQSQVSIL